MITPKKDVIRDMIRQIKGFIVKSEYPCDTFSSFEGVHSKPGVFENIGETETLHTGDFWETGYDRTRWFRFNMTLPECGAGEKVYLNLDFGGEALVRINGSVAGAVTSASETDWQCRDIIFIPENIMPGETFSVEVEATVNCGNFCDLAMDGAKSFMCRIHKASLQIIDELTEKYYYEVSTAFSALNCIGNSVTSKRVYAVIDDSVHQLDFDFERDVFYKSVPTAERVLLDGFKKIPESAVGNVIMTGHSHLDIAWLWTSRELVRKTARTFSNNLALMDRYPQFKFSQSQAIVYDYMKRYYPDIFDEVKKKVRSGQWEITGGAWVEADTNIASGESLIRQLLYGHEFFKKEFGIESEIYWLPDCFGFTWALPQIIKKSGMKYFVTAKLTGNDTNRFPNTAFRRRAHSGDEVTGYLVESGYGGEFNPAEVTCAWERNRQNSITDVSLGMFGYGDGGGGCTYGMVEKGLAGSIVPGLVNVREGSATEFFDMLDKSKEELPVWDGELVYENHRGTFTSQAFVKKNNRRGEFLLRNAELLATVGSLNKTCDFNSEMFGDCWKLLLTNQFHDILPGTSIHEVYDDVRRDYDELNKIGNTLKSNALTAAVKQIKSEKCDVAVFNYNTFSVTAPVKIAVDSENICAFSDDGRCMNGYTEKTDNGYVLEFIAEDVPPAGYKVFSLRESECVSAFSAVSANEHCIENDCLRIELDGGGNITRVFDRINDRDVLSGKSNVLTIHQDKPIHESAWNLEYNIDKKKWALDTAESIEPFSCGSLKGGVKIRRRFNKSVIEQSIVLYSGINEVFFETTVDWHETEKTIKSAFKLNIRATEATYEIAHGAIKRPTHMNTSYDFAKFEVAAHKWADLSEPGYGVSLINDCKYGYDTKGDCMRITLMRSPNCPDRVADQGINTFTYALYPHKNMWFDGGTLERAFIINNPLEAVHLPDNDGRYRNHSFIKISKSNCVLDAFKPAEDGNGCILRVYEGEGRHEKIRIETDFGFTKAYECNLMEKNEAETPISDGAFSFDISPFEVKSFRLIL